MTELVLQPGPTGPKTSFPVLDQQGPRSDRHLSETMNGAMRGKLNCIGEAFYDLASIPAGTTYMRVYDSRISQQSVIVLDPLSISSTLLLVSGRGQGYFDLQVNLSLIAGVNAYGSMRHPLGLTAFTTTPTLVEFSEVGGLIEKRTVFSNPNDSLTVLMAGMYQNSVRIEADGLAINRDFFFDYMVNNVVRATFVYNSGTGGSIRDTVTGYADLAADDIITMENYLSSGSSTPLMYVDVQVMRIDNSPTNPNNLPPSDDAILGDVHFKYAVIG
jgi:hypothetical protein